MDGIKTESKPNRPISPINGQPIPNGRPKGVPNKSTTNARQAIAAFVENNAERLNRLLDKIEAENPAKAFDCIMSVVEYHIPKLSRAEVQNLDENGDPANAVTEIRISYVDTRPTDPTGV